MKAVLDGALAVLRWGGIGIGSLLLLLVVGFVVVPPVTRSFTDRWGATDAEVAATLPGDELVRDARQSATRAITVQAPAELVMRLIRQQGYKRGGWHGWDWFYNATGSGEFVDGHFSTRIVPELQDIALGDRIFINTAVSYAVEQDTMPTATEPGVFLLYGGGAGGKDLRAVDADKATDASTSWVWHVTPLGPDKTRVVLRIRGDMRGQGAFVAWLFDNPLDFGGALFANKTLHGIKATAEALAASE